MPAALPLQTSISQATQGTTAYKILEVKYGNGYSQRAPDGYNNVQAQWNVQWQNISVTDFTTLVTAFDAAAGCDYFTWTAPGDATSSKWIVKQYTRTVASGGVYTIQATLGQVFDL